MWIGLALTYLLLLRTSEVFAEENGVFHEVCCLRRGDVAFFWGGRQLRRRREREADKVEIRFRGSKGGQGRKGAVMVRTRNVRNEGGRGVRRRRGSGAAGGAGRDVQRTEDVRSSATDDLLERNEMGGVDEGSSDLLLSEERNSRSFRRVEPRKTGGEGG